MNVQPTIKIACQGSATCDLDSIKILQGELKSLSTENYERLKRVMLRDGFTSPINIWKQGQDNWCIDGTQRTRVLKKLRDEGHTVPPLPVNWIHAPDLPSAKRILLSHASQYGRVEDEGLYEFINDCDITMEELKSDYSFVETDFKKFEAGFYKDLDKDAIEDDVPDTQEDPKTKLGDLWQLGEHRLLCGDSVSANSYFSLLGEQRDVLLMTDPPYGILKIFNKDGQVGQTNAVECNKYGAFEGEQTFKLKPFLDVASSFIKHKVIWGAQYFAHDLPIKTSWLCWDKRAGERSWFSDCEFAWTDIPGTVAKVFTHTWQGMIKKGESEKRQHPTQKPVALFEWILNDLAPDETHVLDCFGGSGSSLLACEKTNRKCYMMEIEPKYIRVIINRWEKYSDKKAVLLENVL